MGVTEKSWKIANAAIQRRLDFVDFEKILRCPGEVN